eukprot:11937064-Heterocapsa_arctica.AAC.1
MLYHLAQVSMHGCKRNRCYSTIVGELVCDKDCRYMNICEVLVCHSSTPPVQDRPIKVPELTSRVVA